jgi:hypothetical protein
MRDMPHGRIFWLRLDVSNWHDASPETMLMPISLSDSEMDIVMRAAHPLAVNNRDAFLQAVAKRLATISERGDGVVYQICREVQREHSRPANSSRYQPNPSCQADRHHSIFGAGVGSVSSAASAENPTLLCVSFCKHQGEDASGEVAGVLRYRYTNSSGFFNFSSLP